MAHGAIELEIVTPTGTALRETVDELTAPALHGEFGVLPGHVPLLAAVRPGILAWKTKGGGASCAVGWGFIEVSEDHAYVLTDRFVQKDGVDPVRVRADLKDVQEKIGTFSGTADSPDFHALVDDELWCAAQLELHGDPPPATVAFVTPYGPQPEQLAEMEPSEPAPSLNPPEDH